MKIPNEIIMKKLKNCHDCNCKEGELHHSGCDMERCPFCNGQLISCSCCYEMLNIDHFEGTWAYSHGLTKEQEERWMGLLTLRGRIPYVIIPNLCGLCGEQWPEYFGVPNKEWDKFIIPALQGKILCLKCYSKMENLFPKGWRKVKEKKR